MHAAFDVARGDRRRERRHRLAAGRASSAPGPEELVVALEAQAEVRAALRRLPRRSATVLVLRHGGLSYGEIAEAIGVDSGQVGTVLRRAEAALYKEMQGGTRN